MSKKKKLYRLRFPIKTARGEQIYEIEAGSPSEALAIWNLGDSQCVEEEIEVERLGEPQIDEIKP